MTLTHHCQDPQHIRHSQNRFQSENIIMQIEKQFLSILNYYHLSNLLNFPFHEIPQKTIVMDFSNLQTETAGKSHLGQTAGPYSICVTCISYHYWQSTIYSYMYSFRKHTGISLGCGNCELTKICAGWSSEIS